MKTERLLTSESLMLDIIRVLASAIVAFGHLTQSFFSPGWPDCTPLARSAVAIFFVLSGFVIRHVTTRRSANLGIYMGERLSRIYSVAVPALLFTLVADSIARHVNPNFYAYWEGAYYPHPLLRLLPNLLFVAQLWQHNVDPLSNSPYWSVNYEMAYYLGYGFFLYLSTKTRWIWIALLCLVCGPNIMYLAPLWIAGCISHDFYQRWNATETAAANLNRIFAAILLFGVAALSVRFWHRAWFHHLSFSVPTILRHNHIAFSDYIFGVVWLPVFLKMLLFARKFAIAADSRWVKNVRFISEGTFPIYLFHFPIFVLVTALLPYNHQQISIKLLIFTGTMAFGVLAGHPCNLIKDRLRSLFAQRRSKAFPPAPPFLKEKDLP